MATSPSAALLVESLTGHTWRAAELVADGLSQYGWSINSLTKAREPDFGAIQAADLVIVATWVHGAFVVGQAPYGVSTIENLPAMQDKRAAVFCTFGLNPGKSLKKLTNAVEVTGARVMGGLALNRFKLEEHAEVFTTRLVDAVAERPFPARVA